VLSKLADFVSAEASPIIKVVVKDLAYFVRLTVTISLFLLLVLSFRFSGWLFASVCCLRKS